MSRLLISGTIAVIALLGADFAWHYPMLPLRMASHFDAAGNPNDTMSRSIFVTFALITVVGIAALLGSLGYLLPRMPSGMIHLPHRDFWLAPEHRAATFAYIRKALALLGILVTAHLAIIFHLALVANLTPNPSLGK